MFLHYLILSTCFLEKGMATHSSILAWRIHMDRGPWQAIVNGVTQSWTWRKWFSMSTCLISSPTILHLLTVLLLHWPMMSLKQTNAIPNTLTLSPLLCLSSPALTVSQWTNSSLLLAKQYFTEQPFFPWSCCPEHPQFTLFCFISS